MIGLPRLHHLALTAWHRTLTTMTAHTVTTTRTLLDCPACKKPIFAEIVFDVKLNPIPYPEGERPPLAQASVSATLKIAGVRVAHDCLPSLPTGDAPIHA